MLWSWHIWMGGGGESSAVFFIEWAKLGLGSSCGIFSDISYIHLQTPFPWFMYDIGPFFNPCSNCPGMWTLAWRDHPRSCQEDCRDSKCSLRHMTIGPPDGLPSWRSISSWQGVSLLTPQKKRWWTGWHISGFLLSTRSRWFYSDSLFLSLFA